MRIRPGRYTRPDGTFVAVLFPPAAHRQCKSPVDKQCRTSRLRPPLVLFQGPRQRGGEVNAQVIGQQDDDEEHITELISGRAGRVLGRTWLVAELKVQLATELTDLLRQSRVLRKG